MFNIAEYTEMNETVPFLRELQREERVMFLMFLCY